MNCKLSVFAIAKDEARNIPSFLQHLQGFAEEVVIVVDASTQDDTLQLAQSLGAKAMLHPFTSYSAQKQYALAQCTGEWVLNLDLDERLTDALKAEISSTIARTSANLIRLPLHNIFLGKRMRWGDLLKACPPRLARRSVAHYGDDLVHERLTAPGKVIKLKNYYWHESYQNLTEYMAKMNAYSTAWALDKFKQGKKFKWWNLVRFPGDFLQAFIIQMGILQGYRGIILSIGKTFYTFFKYAKLAELYQQKVIGKKIK
ncbi:MAG: glycosyltransferase family 2 protein [Bacteriovoracaceae bacterium]|nr:glycosyltransferase family 2 protein [Bacteriovoracaceae bacterium]